VTELKSLTSSYRPWSTFDVQWTLLCSCSCSSCSCLQPLCTSYSPHVTPADNWSGTDIGLQSDTVMGGLLQCAVVWRPSQQHPKAAACPE